MMEQNNTTNFNTNSTLKRNVMLRVRTVHAMRRVCSNATLSGVIFVLALWGIGREVWVARVFQNAPSLTNIAAAMRFFLYAFLDTRLIVQVLTIVALGAFVWFAYQAARLVRDTQNPSLRAV
jgi:hypothetical protein